MFIYFFNIYYLYIWFICALKGFFNIQWTPLIRTTVNRNNRFIGPKWLGTDRPYINTLKIHRLMEPNPSLYCNILWPRSLKQREIARTSAGNSVFWLLLMTSIFPMCPTLILSTEIEKKIEKTRKKSSYCMFVFADLMTLQ